MGDCRLQVIGWTVIAVTAVMAMIGAARYSGQALGQVLGASAPPSSAEVVATILTEGVVNQVQAGYGMVIVGFVMLFGAIVIYQVMGIIKKLGSDMQFGLVNILKIAMIDSVIFVLTIVALAGFNAWTIKYESPQKLQYERLSEEVVRVTWESHSKTMSQILWGYDPSHLDNLSLGAAGENKTKNHEVVLSVRPQDEVYFKIVVNGIKYGESGANSYYYLPRYNQTNKLYELKLKDKP